MQRVARRLRKVIKHSAITAPKTQYKMGRSAACTTSFVAAMTPALPLARRNVALSEGWAAEKVVTER